MSKQATSRSQVLSALKEIEKEVTRVLGKQQKNIITITDTGVFCDYIAACIGAGTVLPQTESILQQMGEQIKASRLRRRLSVELVAQRAGVSRATVWNVEKGNPSVAIGIYALGPPESMITKLLSHCTQQLKSLDIRFTSISQIDLSHLNGVKRLNLAENAKLVSVLGCRKDRFKEIWLDYFEHLSTYSPPNYSLQSAEGQSDDSFYIRCAECVYDRAGLPTTIYHICVRLGE